MIYDFTYIQNLTNKISEQAEQKQIHKYGEHFAGCQMGGRVGVGETGEGIKKYKLAFTEQSQGCKAQHREYSQYCNNYVWYQMDTRFIRMIIQ